MSDTKHETRGGRGRSGGACGRLHASGGPARPIGLACLYPVAVLGALWSVNRWPAIVIGLIATGGVLAPFVGGSGAAGGGLIGGAGLVVAIWLAVAMVLRHRGATSAEADLLRRTFEALPAGLVVYDGADRMALCNPANKSLYPAVADRMVSARRSRIWSAPRRQAIYIERPGDRGFCARAGRAAPQPRAPAFSGAQ